MRSLLRKIRVLFYVYRSINKWWAKVELVISKLEEKGYPVEKMIGLAIYDSEGGGTVLVLPCWVERIVNNYSMNVGVDLECTKSLSEEVRRVWDKEEARQAIEQTTQVTEANKEEVPHIDEELDDYIGYDPYYGYYVRVEAEEGVSKGEEFLINEDEAMFRKPSEYLVSSTRS